jgi:integrase
MMVEVSEQTVRDYQDQRLREKASPKTVNDEVGFLLRVMEDAGDLLRVRLKKKHLLKLKVRNTVGKAYSDQEKASMLECAREARSPHIYPALMLALNAGIRDAELKNLTWGQLDLGKNILTVGKSKTDAGEGRTIPLNSDLRESIDQYMVWYRERFAEIRSEWYVFPFGSPRPCDPTRPVTTLKTSWTNLRKKSGVKGRWHDNRHTLITELAESGAGDQTIMDIAGHVSKQMLSHYSHIRTQAKRDALETVARRRRSAVEESRQEGVAMPNNTQGFEGESLQSRNFEGDQGVKKRCKSMNLIGGRGRNRTYNLSVKRGNSANCTELHRAA